MKIYYFFFFFTLVSAADIYYVNDMKTECDLTGLDYSTIDENLYQIASSNKICFKGEVASSNSEKHFGRVRVNDGFKFLVSFFPQAVSSGFNIIIHNTDTAQFHSKYQQSNNFNFISNGLNIHFDFANKAVKLNSIVNGKQNELIEEYKLFSPIRYQVVIQFTNTEIEECNINDYANKFYSDVLDYVLKISVGNELLICAYININSIFNENTEYYFTLSSKDNIGIIDSELQTMTKQTTTEISCGNLNVSPTEKIIVKNLSDESEEVILVSFSDTQFNSPSNPCLSELLPGIKYTVNYPKSSVLSFINIHSAINLLNEFTLDLTKEFCTYSSFSKYYLGYCDCNYCNEVYKISGTYESIDECLEKYLSDKCYCFNNANFMRKSICTYYSCDWEDKSSTSLTHEAFVDLSSPSQITPSFLSCINCLSTSSCKTECDTFKVENIPVYTAPTCNSCLISGEIIQVIKIKLPNLYSSFLTCLNKNKQNFKEKCGETGNEEGISSKLLFSGELTHYRIQMGNEVKCVPYNNYNIQKVDTLIYHSKDEAFECFDESGTGYSKGDCVDCVCYDTCPLGQNGLPCSGKGVCSLNGCICDDGYYEDDCSSHCKDSAQGCCYNEIDDKVQLC